jgi:protein involved in polysaccharide export with SLBB domain
VPGYPHKREGAASAVRLNRLPGAALLVLFLFAIAACAPAQTPSAPANAPASAPTPEYRIGPGDDLSITFPSNAELNHDGPVAPDGRFTLPLLGNIELAGKTLNQASAMISEALRTANIVQNAYPNVTVRHYGTNVYVGGQVKTPGVVQLVSGMDALQAIFAAGGLTDSAKTGKVAIIRRGADNHPHVVYLNVKAYTQGKADSIIAVLEPRDIIFVPRSKIAEVDLWVDNYINKALPFSRGITYSYGNYPVDTVLK